MHRLPPLPYDWNALEPALSAATLKHHYQGHHQGYLDALNGLIEGSELAALPLAETLERATGGTYSNAAQAWNHAFYWRCMAPAGQSEPEEALIIEIIKHFGSLERLRRRFIEAAMNHFGSGWAWLVAEPDHTLEVITTPNADTPLVYNRQPLLACDIWEHAYYLDYQQDRRAYLEAFWGLIDWAFVERAYAGRTELSTAA